MRNDIYEKLKNIARTQTLICYEDLNSQLHLGLNFDLSQDRDKIGQWLGEISEEEVKEGRHMLSAVVGHKNGDNVSDPGKGFYNWAQTLGVFHGGDDLAKIDFWVKEVKWLYNYWKNH